MPCPGGAGAGTGVDDDNDSRDALDELLRLDGLIVQSASDGRHGLALLRAGCTPCVILLDLRMRGIDGAEFRAEQLRERALASIPVVLISGDSRLAARATELGVRDALLKPINYRELRALIDTYCEHDDPPAARSA